MIATPLLETIGQELLASISEIDTRVRKVQIRIEKSNPPIEGFEGTVAVTCTKLC
jgi:dihydroneopterin aldolase